MRYASSGVFLFSKPLRHFDSVLLCYCYEPPAHQFIALLVIPALFVVQAGNVPEFSVQRIRIHIVIEFALDLPLALELCETQPPAARGVAPPAWSAIFYLVAARVSAAAKRRCRTGSRPTRSACILSIAWAITWSVHQRHERLLPGTGFFGGGHDRVEPSCFLVVQAMVCQVLRGLKILSGHLGLFLRLKDVVGSLIEANTLTSCVSGQGQGVSGNTRALCLVLRCRALISSREHTSNRPRGS